MQQQSSSVVLQPLWTLHQEPALTAPPTFEPRSDEPKKPTTDFYPPFSDTWPRTPVWGSTRNRWEKSQGIVLAATNLSESHPANSDGAWTCLEEITPSRKTEEPSTIDSERVPLDRFAILHHSDQDLKPPRFPSNLHPSGIFSNPWEDDSVTTLKKSSSDPFAEAALLLQYPYSIEQ